MNTALNILGLNREGEVSKNQIAEIKNDEQIINFKELFSSLNKEIIYSEENDLDDHLLKNSNMELILLKEEELESLTVKLEEVLFYLKQDLKNPLSEEAKNIFVEIKEILDELHFVDKQIGKKDNPGEGADKHKEKRYLPELMQLSFLNNNAKQIKQISEIIAGKVVRDKTEREINDGIAFLEVDEFQEIEMEKQPGSIMIKREEPGKQLEKIMPEQKELKNGDVLTDKKVEIEAIVTEDLKIESKSEREIFIFKEMAELVEEIILQLENDNLAVDNEKNNIIVQKISFLLEKANQEKEIIRQNQDINKVDKFMKREKSTSFIPGIKRNNLENLQLDLEKIEDEQIDFWKTGELNELDKPTEEQHLILPNKHEKDIVEIIPDRILLEEASSGKTESEKSLFINNGKMETTDQQLFSLQGGGLLKQESSYAFMQRLSTQIENWFEDKKGSVKIESASETEQADIFSGSFAEIIEDSISLEKSEQLPDMVSIIENINEQLEIMKGKKQNQINLKLQPEFLGEVDLQLKVESGEVMARFIVNNQEGRSFLEQNIFRLRENLMTEGFNVVSLDIEAENPDTGFNQNQGFHEFFEKQQGGQTEDNFLELIDFQSEFDEVIELAGSLHYFDRELFPYGSSNRYMNLLV